MNDEYDPQSVDPPPPWEPAEKRRKDSRRKNLRSQSLRRDTKPLGPASRRLARRRLARQLNTRRKLLLAGAISLSLLVVALLAFWQLTGQGPFVTQTAPLTPPVSLIDLATEYPELAEILGDPKLDSAYKDFLVAYQTGGSETALELARQRGLLNANGDLRLTLELDTEESAPLQRELEENGIHVTAISGNLMDVAVPLGLLERLMAAGTADNLLVTITNLDHVVRIRLPQVDVHDQTEQDTPAASPPALGTPPAVTPSPTGAAAGLLSSNWFMLGLGVLLCVVAPLLLGFGVYLLISGLGLTRRKSFAPDSLPLPGGEPGAGRTTLSGESASSMRTHAQEPLPPAGTVTATEDAMRTNQPAPAPAVQNSARQTPPPVLPSAPRPQPPTESPAAAPVGMIACERCGHANRAGAKFCANCGASLLEAAPPPRFEAPTLVGTPTPQPQTPPAASGGAAPIERPTYCWNCGQRLRPTSQFCPYCGDRI